MTEEKKPQSGVFYVDGSCRPHNPGYIGWGLHGYIYEEEATKPVVVDGFTHTSHGYIKQGQTPDKKVIPVEVIPIEYLDGFGSCEGFLSNNVAEIQALLNLLKVLNDRHLQKVTVFTDSEHLKHCMNDWCKTWERNGWLRRDMTPVSNREWIEPTYMLLKQIRARGTDISINWIRSHEGHLGNERVDVLAKIGSNYSVKGNYQTTIETSPAKNYWNVDIERSPYIPFRRLFFNTVKEYHREGVYHIAESSDNDYIVGKASSSSGYSVVYLKEPDAIIELIKQKQFDNSRNINVIVLLKLDSVYSKQVYPWLQKYGDMAIDGQRNNHSMTLVNKTPITVEQSPAGLSLRQLDFFGMLEELLISFNNNQINGDTFKLGAVTPNVHDITDRFFNKITDKKGKDKLELKPEFIVGFKNLPLVVQETVNDKVIDVKIPYILGLDCLPRNNLKYLEDANPKILLITWPEAGILRYATVIDSDIGIGIWSNYFANQVLLPSGK